MIRTTLRQLLQQKKTLLMPGAYNPCVARLIEQEGFDGVYISGAGLANSMGIPDDGTLTRKDFTYFADLIAKAVRVPVICDADTGFDSGAKNSVATTVKEYIRCGLSALHVEDQVFPKRCGHLSGKEVISREAMQEKIHRMCRARDRYDMDFMIIARTDARGAHNVEESRQLEESIERGRAYLDAGADMIFPESLRTQAEFRKFRASTDAPLLANMTEFGRTRMLTAAQFESLGYNIVIYPVSLFRYAANQTLYALKSLRKNGNQSKLIAAMMRRERINSLLDYKPG
ncbi:MAG: isocitrate lyase/phosphoenolpyruvate mutase family protein [Acidobacteriota bacterium]